MELEGSQSLPFRSLLLFAYRYSLRAYNSTKEYIIIGCILIGLFGGTFTEIVTLPLIVASLTVIYSVAAHRKYKFIISNEKVSLVSGILQRAKTAIFEENIDRVEIKQNFISRCLFIYDVDLYSSGSSQPAVSLEGVTEKELFAIESMGVVDEKQLEKQNDTFEVNLSLLDVLKSAMTVPFYQYILKGMIPTIACLYLSLGIDMPSPETIAERVVQSKNETEVSRTSMLYVTAYAVLLMIFSIVGKMLFYVPKAMRSKITVENGLLRCEQGLVNKTEWSLNLADLYYMEIKTGLFAWAGWNRVIVSTVSGRQEIPFLNNDQLQEFLSLTNFDNTFIKTSRQHFSYLPYRVFTVGLLGTLLATLFTLTVSQEFRTDDDFYWNLQLYVTIAVAISFFVFSIGQLTNKLADNPSTISISNTPYHIGVKLLLKEKISALECYENTSKVFNAKHLKIHSGRETHKLAYFNRATIDSLFKGLKGT